MPVSINLRPEPSRTSIITDLRAPNGMVVTIEPDDTFVRINQHGNVFTTRMFRKFRKGSPADRTAQDGYIRTTLNGVTIEHPEYPSESSQRTFIACCVELSRREQPAQPE